ncbi:MAG: hypothetical protein ACLRPW_13320, partial [Intestinibacter sp.]
VAYIEGHEKSEDLDMLLKKYNTDYNYQRLKNLKWEAEFISQNSEKKAHYRKKINAIKRKYQIDKEQKDYWWAGLNSFSAMCNNVVLQSGNFKMWVRNMQLIYKRACLAIHSSCMGIKLD